MRKLKCLFLMLMLLSVVACQKAKPAEVMDLPEQKTDAAKDAAVDSVGTDIDNVDTVDDDLNTDDLGELDSGLADIESI